MEAWLDYRGVVHTAAGWNLITSAAIPDLIASDGVTQTGWSLGGTFGLPSAGNFGPATTTGAAAWVTPSAVSQGVRFSTLAEGSYNENTIGNLNDTKTYTVECFSSTIDANRVTRWRVNGATQDLNASDGAGTPNASETVIFAGVSPIAGVITFGFSKGPGSGTTTATAMRIIEDAGPGLTVTQTELTPGNTISGTYADYATIPTTLTVSEGTNSITVPTPTIVDAGDGTGTFSGTMPALPTTGSANGIRFTDAAIVELT